MISTSAGHIYSTPQLPSDTKRLTPQPGSEGLCTVATPGHRRKAQEGPVLDSKGGSGTTAHTQPVVVTPAGLPRNPLAAAQLTASQLPGVRRLAQLQSHYPVLRAGGIVEIQPGQLPRQYIVAKDVDMNTGFKSLRVAEGRNAIGSWGAASCYCIAARGLDSKGVPVLALAHYSTTFDDAGEALRQMMSNEDVKSYQVYVVGGQVSRYVKVDDPQCSTGDSLEEGMAWIQLLRPAAARIGMAQTEEGEPCPTGFLKGPTTGRAESNTVVVTADNVYVAPEHIAGSALYAMPAEAASDEEMTASEDEASGDDLGEGSADDLGAASADDLGDVSGGAPPDDPPAKQG